MTIKSLLLGSAAALVAVSGARAADAIIAEPEPVEYVRVCDAYGAGFFYIPGTETCLRISGEVRVQIDAYSNSALWNQGSAFLGTTGVWPNAALATNGMTSYARGRVKFDARSDTEWGTLQSFIQIQGSSTSDTVDGAVLVDQAFITLGGFFAGYSESAYAHGFASAGAGFTDSGGSYGYTQRVRLSYTFAANGFSGIIALEDDASGDYTPDVVIGVAYSGGWGSIFAKAAYDSATGDVTTIGSPQTGPGSWYALGGLIVNVPNAPGSAFKLVGFWSQRGWYGAPAGFSAGNSSTYAVSHFGGLLASQWSVLASYKHVFNPQFAAAATVQYHKGFSVASGQGFGTTGWTFEADLIFTPIQNLEIRAELTHDRVSTPLWPATATRTKGFLRFTRSF